jgi:hypothetical protein
MMLRKHEVARISDAGSTNRMPQYSVSGLPPGEFALIAQFPQRGWAILRWNEEWHGNWAGGYATPEAALEALNDQIKLALA